MDDRKDNAGGPAVLDLADPVDVRTRSAGEAEHPCPSCDSPGAWTPSRRHRFNPFGGVLAVVLSFWAMVIGLPLGFGPWPALVLAAVGAGIMVSTRTALVCQVCGFVKPRH